MCGHFLPAAVRWFNVEKRSLRNADLPDINGCLTNYTAQCHRAGAATLGRVVYYGYGTSISFTIRVSSAVRVVTVCESVAVVVLFLPGQGYSWVNTGVSNG